MARRGASSTRQLHTWRRSRQSSPHTISPLSRRPQRVDKLTPPAHPSWQTHPPVYCEVKPESGAHRMPLRSAAEGAAWTWWGAEA